MIRQKVDLRFQSEAGTQSEFEQTAIRVVGMWDKVSSEKGHLRTYADAVQWIPKRGIKHQLSKVIGYSSRRVGVSRGNAA